VFAVIYAIAILLTVTSTETASNTAATTALQHPEIIPYLIVLQLLLIGPGEELLFRGVIQGRCASTSARRRPSCSRR